MSKAGLSFWRRMRQRSWRPGPVEPGVTTLGLRRIYIVPSRPGLVYALTMLLLFLGATNYNLGLGFALTFFLVSVGLIDIHLTWRNLAGVELQAGRALPVFAGEEAHFELSLHNPSKQARHALLLGFIAPGERFAEQSIDLAPHSKHSVSLSVSSSRRGWLAAPKVQIYTRFPLGLLHAWSYWQPDARVLVYPQAEEEAPPLPFSGDGAGQGTGRNGNEEFAGVRSYQSGDAMRNIAWRQVARLDPELGGNLVSKIFEGGQHARLHLDLAALPPELDVEARLSRLTRWVLQAEQLGHPWSLRLGALELPLAEGADHCHACLQALALYDEGGKP
ncbi:DUF58 domain-containing protein [Massilia sp. W12]|uniref:DUF58 domain-containing protein n=1 Tax=Massilia sp. W12 TaxID=3126507 RepID=UPI0030D1115E